MTRQYSSTQGLDVKQRSKTTQKWTSDVEGYILHYRQTIVRAVGYVGRYIES